MKKNFIAIIAVSLFIPFASCAVSTNTTFDKTFYQDFKNLDIDLSSENISIKETRNQDFSIEIACNDKSRQPTVNLTNDTIEILGRKNIHFSVGYRCHVYLYVPEGYHFENIDIELSSGSLDTDALYGDEIFITSSSGDLKMRKVDAKSKANIKSTSGSIKVSTLYSNDSVKLNSTSGSIVSNKVDSIYFDAHTISGSMEFNDFFCDSFDIKSTSGSLLMDFSDVPAAKSFIESTSGSIKIFIPGSSSFTLDYETSSGSFSDNRNGNRIRASGSTTQDYNGGGVEISVKTTSGSLVLDD